MNETQSFLKNAFIAGGIFGIVLTVIGIYSGYSQINSDFDGTGLPPGTYTSIVVCLMAALVGLVTVKMQSGIEIEMTLGRGALIGLVSGIIAAILSTSVNQIWHLIEPNYIYEMAEAMVENYEKVPGFSAKMAEEMGAEIIKSNSTISGVLQSLALNAGFYAILNALSGMLGAKLFCDDPAEL